METPNLLAVLLGGVAAMVIGALYYGPLFGKAWMRLMNTTEEEIQATMNPLKTYGLTFIAFLVVAYVLGHIVQAYAAAFGLSGLMAGLQAGFWCWLGFVAAIRWQAVAYEDEPLALYGLNLGYNLLCFLAIGALHGWLG